MNDCLIVRRGKGVKKASWFTGAVAPATAYRYTSQLYNGKIYCPQGFGTELHIYDIESDTWSTGADAPSATAYRSISQLYNNHKIRKYHKNFIIKLFYTP